MTAQSVRVTVLLHAEWTLLIGNQPTRSTDPKCLPCVVLLRESCTSITPHRCGSHTGQRMENPLVLIVDSEALIRMSAVDIVEDAGFSALEASSAEDAIRLLERRSDIQAVFTDINMSGSMDGLNLAHAIRKRWPPVHLLVASGMGVQEKLPINGRFIRKPYSTEQVASALYELFGYSPAPGGLDSASCQKRARLA